MGRSLRSPLLLAAALAALPLAARAADCRPAALEELRASAPDGYGIYRRIADKGFFLAWVDCGDAQRELPTAVHESVHAITADTDAFPLVGGGDLPRPHEASAFFPPARIATAFRSSDFVSTYLRAARSSAATDFLYLLDELNAYAHDLNAAVDLHGPDVAGQMAGQEVDHRDGLAALMAFVAVYLKTAAASEPATWAGLRQPRVAATVTALWGQAERVMASSCDIPHFGAEDRGFLRQACEPGAAAAVQAVIGRPPACPARCLAAPPAVASDPGEETRPVPLNRRAFVRR